MKTNQITFSEALIRWLLVAVVLAWGLNAPTSRAQEHPEHPSGAAKAESALTLEEVAKHIESHVKQESKDGAFKVEDKKTGKPLALTLDRIHRERLSQVGPEMYFICADFKGVNGRVYDMDFFLQGTRKENLHVLPEKTSVHKEDGKERYTWAFDDDKNVWVQKPVETSAKEQSAPEHP